MDMGHIDSRAFVATDFERALRPLDWGELCARLVAAQDLRREQARERTRLAAGAIAPGGSFHAVAAALLSREGLDALTSTNYAQSFVNQNHLTNSKGRGGTPVDSRDASTDFDPELGRGAPSRREMP